MTGAADGFDRHYRELVANALRRSASSELDFHRASGHRLRAWRAARRLRALGGEPGGEAAPGLGRQAGAARVAAGIALVALLAGVRHFGVHSWWTGAADIALIALTFGWFLIDARRSGDPRPGTGEGASRGS